MTYNQFLSLAQEAGATRILSVDGEYYVASFATGLTVLYSHLGGGSIVPDDNWGCDGEIIAPPGSDRELADAMDWAATHSINAFWGAADTLYVLSERDNAHDTIVDALPVYGLWVYRRDIANGDLDQIVEEEWDYGWASSVDTQGGNTYSSEGAARDAREESPSYGRRHIVEITRDDVRAALLEVFAPHDG